MTAAQASCVTVDLNDLGMLGVELTPGKVGAQKNQRVAAVHHVET